MMLADFLFGRPEEEDRVLAEGVQIVREWTEYSLSICCPRDSDLGVLESLIRRTKGVQWSLARDESDFENGCDNSEHNRHILFLWSEVSND